MYIDFTTPQLKISSAFISYLTKESLFSSDKKDPLKDEKQSLVLIGIFLICYLIDYFPSFHVLQIQINCPALLGQFF